jgi:hypothetical protein
VSDEPRPAQVEAPARPPRPPRRWRRPAVLLAIAIDVVVVIGVVVLVANGGSPVLVALGAILAFAPWAAIIDEMERPRRH